MIISTTSIIPHSYRVYSSEAIVPMAVTFGSHLIWPFVLDPYFTTFNVCPSSDVTRVFRQLIISSERVRYKIFASRLVSCFGFWVLGFGSFRIFPGTSPICKFVFHTERSFSTELLECATRVLPIIDSHRLFTISVICFGSRGG